MDYNIKKMSDVFKKYAPQFLVGVGAVTMLGPYMVANRRVYNSKIEHRPEVKVTKKYNRRLLETDWMCETTTDSINEAYNEYISSIEFE